MCETLNLCNADWTSFGEYVKRNSYISAIDVCLQVPHKPLLLLFVNDIVLFSELVQDIMHFAEELILYGTEASMYYII